MLLNFKDERLLTRAINRDCLEDFRNPAFGEFYVHHTTQDLHYTAS
jgi:hypothetical protein